MKKLKKVFLFLLFVLSTCLMFGCQGDNNTKEKDVDYLTFAQDSYTVVAEDVFQIEFETSIDPSLLTWASTFTSIADVDATGNVTTYRHGITIISASYQSLYAECIVNVEIKPLEIIYHTVTIHGEKEEQIQVREKTRIYNVLIDKYKDKTYLNIEGKTFVGWFLNSSMTEECVLTDMIMSDIDLYPKYVDDKPTDCLTLTVDRVIGKDGSFNADGNVQIFSSSYAGKIQNQSFTYEDQLIVVVTYSIEKMGYYVTDVIEDGVKSETKIPYNGFVIAINKSQANYQSYKDELTVGAKINLDRYSANVANKIYVNQPVQPFYNEFTLTEYLSCEFSSIYDVTHGTKIFEKNGDEKAYPASTTKVMTALTALQFADLDDTYVIGDDVALTYQGSEPSVAGLAVGQTWTLRQLLYAMLLPSGNDGAYAVAACAMQHFPEYENKTMREKIDKFAELMTELAHKIGATNSQFRSPDGNSYYKNQSGSPYNPSTWDDRLTYHYVTANDMAKIANYAFTYGAIAEVVSTASISFDVTDPNKTAGTTKYSFTNTNSFLKSSSNYYDPTVVGLKTGTTTPAGQCLIVGVERDGRFIIIVVLKSTDRYGCMKFLINSVFK